MFVILKKEFFGNPPGKTIDVSREHAELLIKDGAAEAVAGDPLAPLVARTMEQAMARLSDGISAAVNAALKQFGDAQAQARRHAVPAIFGSDGAALAEGKNPKHCFGDWLLKVAANDWQGLDREYPGTYAADLKGNILQKAALAESSGVTGGYVVPPEFFRELQALIVEKAIIRPRAYVQPMASATLMVPYLDVTTPQSAGVSPFFGGVTMTWTEEAQTRTETEPQFKQMELKAHELSGYAVSSNVLLQDAAFGLEKFLMTLFSQAIAWFEDYAFLQGNGTGKPMGILNSGALAVVSSRANANQFAFSDAAKMLGKLLPASQKKAIWCISPTVIQQLVQLADGSGRIVWVPNIGGAQDPIPGTLFGLDVIVTEKLPALGTQGDVLLIDPSLYIVGDRMQIEIAASQHVNFLKNQMTWRVVERVDGQPWLDKPITLQDGSTTVSPFVALHA